MILITHNKIEVSLREKICVILCCLFSAVFFSFFLPVAPSSSAGMPTHLDKTNIKKGCSECHKGHGRRGSVMLVQQGEELCFNCHGAVNKSRSDGKSTDVYSVIMKNSSHPIVQTSHYHVPGELLPDSSIAAQRHASCLDCHNVHKSQKGNALKGLRGYSGRGRRIKQITHEYELCYNCHSDQGNPAKEEGNVALDFAPSNSSVHPVETVGKKSHVPSLKKGYSRSTTITCSDCHGNDDPSGPQGPHGSIYAPILKYRYLRAGTPESASSYELCYACHDRNSILGDESFKAHKVHIVYNQVSCAQCHDAHGSRFNPSLINFDQTVVFPNLHGELTYLPMMPGKPRCYLSCHLGGRVYEHALDKTLRYSINGRRTQE